MKLPLRTVSVLFCAGALCFGQSGANPGSAPQASPPVVEEPHSPEPRSPKPTPQTVTDNSGAVAATPAVPPPAAGDSPNTTAPPPAGPPKTTSADRSTAMGAKPGAKPYVIGPLDVLDVSVWNDAKLSHIYDVSPDGTISMPLIGLVKADGLTPVELGASITEKLLAVLNSPEVNVQVLKVNSKKYYMFGGVNRPGEYPLNGETTVLDAFANCSGFHDFAKKKKIRIIRKGVANPIFFNYEDVSKGKHMEQNILLQNGDRIFVDE
jgi:polysaccharide export outer membrane protein